VRDEFKNFFRASVTIMDGGTDIPNDTVTSYSKVIFIDAEAN
jgi:hypothetical protein